MHTEVIILFTAYLLVSVVWFIVVLSLGVFVTVSLPQWAFWFVQSKTIKLQASVIAYNVVVAVILEVICFRFKCLFGGLNKKPQDQPFGHIT